MITAGTDKIGKGQIICKHQDCDRKMYPKIFQLISITILLSVVTACTTPDQNQASSENKPIPEKQTPIESNQSAKNRPPNKTAAISVEGEKTAINLKLYQEKNLFSIYFPQEDFLAKAENFAQQKGVKFIANFGGVKNEDAYVKVVFPNNLKNIEEVKKIINGKNGIIASNKWKVINGNKIFNYPWIKDKISLNAGKDMVCDIYIGEQKGKVFYVITHFPVEYGDGFVPREYLILNSLEVDE